MLRAVARGVPRWQPRRAGAHAAAARGALRPASASPGCVRILRSDVKDIIFHFAVEEYLMREAAITGPLMYLWRPGPVVTIGRHQNPWKECVLSQLEADGVALVRRRSGGGAVFQDLGNSVFTFITPAGMLDIDKNLGIVIGALGRCGITAEKKGRNDLTCEDKKISGSAFRHVPDRVSLHHGTILVNADMQALQRYLTPDKRKLQAKGIASVGARVMNLSERFPGFDHDQLCDAMVAEFQATEAAPDVAVECLTEDSEIARDPAFRRYRDELEDPKWRLGSTPEFSHQLDTRIDGIGVLDVHMQVIAGKVEDVKIFSDALYPDVIDQAMVALRGVDYGRRGIRAALEGLGPSFEDQGPRDLVQAMTEWLVANVDD